jgi:hypothetical protein
VTSTSAETTVPRPERLPELDHGHPPFGLGTATRRR